MNDNQLKIATEYLKVLCSNIPERCVASEGNRLATTFFNEELSSRGWQTELQEFSSIDWFDGGAELIAGNNLFEVFVSPYSLPCSLHAELACVDTIKDLQNGRFQEKILFLHGEIAREQLMPKNFVFYNPDEHRQIISLLEKSGAKALICATGRNPELAGGIYPFPLIEDGDFNIPSVYMTEEEGEKLKPFRGKIVSLKSSSQRIPGKGFNVIGRNCTFGAKRIIITAHIDAKKGTPGATDNATGIVVLLLLSELLKNYDGDKLIELVALNGEDHFAVPGQMTYLAANEDKFSDVLLNINIDGAGYLKGKSTFSFFDLPENIKSKAQEIIQEYPDIKEGVLWPQGDHSMFLQQGIPALAISSQWYTENPESQDITHTPKDNPEIVDLKKIIEIALVVSRFVNIL